MNMKTKKACKARCLAILQNQLTPKQPWSRHVNFNEKVFVKGQVKMHQ